MSSGIVYFYGIKNCDIMKKVLIWVLEWDIEYVFYDYKKEGVDCSKLVEWCKILGWKILVNIKGMIWKKLMLE